MSTPTCAPAEIVSWLDDQPFLDGRAVALLGEAIARREQLGRAQELAHRLLERFCWGTDPSGRILLPGSRAEQHWLGAPPELAALGHLASGGPATDLLRETRAALAAPDPPPGPRRIATVLAAFHRDLADAAGGERGLVPAEFRPAGEIDPRDYEAPGRRPVLAAARHLAERPDLFSLALVHGSLATLDERPGVSDLDLLVVLTPGAAADPDGLLAAREAALGLWPILQQVDPLQHHGTFVLTPADLAFYPQTFLPLAAIREARVLAGPAEGLPAVLRPTGLPRRTILLRAAEMLRRPLPDSLFLAKLHLQVVLLAPCFLLEARGRFLYKRDAFEPFAAAAPVAAARAVTAASRARAENLYAAGLGDLDPLRAHLSTEGLPPLLEAALLQRHLLQPLPEPLRDLLSPGASADRAALADLLEEACPPLGEDLADEEFPRGPAGAPPAPALRLDASEDAGQDPTVRRWAAVARRYVAALGAERAVVAAWGIGTPEPGSDLDLVLVVDREAAASVDWVRCLAALEALDGPDRELLEHPPSAILPVDLVDRAGLLSPLFRCTGLWGPPPREEWWRAPSAEAALSLAADYVLAMYPGELLRFERVLAGEEVEHAPGPSGITRRLGAIRHTLALAREAGIEPPPGLAELVEAARELRRRAEEPVPPERLAALVDEAIPLLGDLAARIAGALVARGWPRREAGDLPRVRGVVGDRIVLVEGAGGRDLAAIGRALEAAAPGRMLTNAAPLPLAWGVLDSVRRHEPLREFFGAEFARLVPDVPPAPPAFRARWDAIAAHLAFLRSIRCPFAWFYPNHLNVDPWPWLVGEDAP